MDTASDPIVRIKLEPPLPAGGLRTFGVGYERLMSSFLAGPENALVAELFHADQLKQLAVYSPIVLYGPHGCGKTALAYSLQCRWETANSQKRALQFAASDFARQLIGAIAADDMPHFREKIRKASSLLIDSIDDINAKTTAQEELIHVIDELHERELPIFVTCLKLPQSIRGLHKGLASRMMAGVQVPISLPSKPTIEFAIPELSKSGSRVAHEKKTTRTFLDRLPSDLSLQTIRGMFLDYMAATHNEKQSVELALFEDNAAIATKDETKLIDSIIKSRNPQSSIKPPQIAKAVAKLTGASLSDIRGSSRRSHIVQARSLAMYLCRTLLEMPLEKIGSFLAVAITRP